MISSLVNSELDLKSFVCSRNKHRIHKEEEADDEEEEEEDDE
jgi:hypothetical protein